MFEFGGENSNQSNASHSSVSDHEENDEALKRPGIKRKRKLDTHDQSSGHAKHAKADPTKKISDFFGKVCFVVYV
jgi:hypothetical protein